MNSLIFINNYYLCANCSSIERVIMSIHVFALLYQQYSNGICYERKFIMKINYLQINRQHIRIVAGVVIFATDSAQEFKNHRNN